MSSEIITRTVYGAGLQNALLLRRPYGILPNSTLNQKLSIRANDTLDPGVYPSICCYVLGRKGTRRQVTAGGEGYDLPVKHRPRDAAPFEMVPHVLRLLSDDIPESERSKYVLRRIELIGPVEYVAYYGKWLNVTNTEIEYTLTTVSNGNESPIPFVPNSGDLNPTQPVLPPVGSTPALADGDYLDVTSTIPITFNAVDVQEFENVCMVKFGDPLLASISEIGIVSGVPKVVTVTGAGGASFPFTEVTVAQISHHITTNYNLAFATSGFNLTVDIGATEPMLIEQ